MALLAEKQTRRNPGERTVKRFTECRGITGTGLYL
jgi:hypothetical protein